jgi:hypothetical protein
MPFNMDKGNTRKRRHDVRRASQLLPLAQSLYTARRLFACGTRAAETLAARKPRSRAAACGSRAAREPRSGLSASRQKCKRPAGWQIACGSQFGRTHASPARCFAVTEARHSGLLSSITTVLQHWRAHTLLLRHLLYSTCVKRGEELHIRVHTGRRYIYQWCTVLLLTCSSVRRSWTKIRMKCTFV